MVTDIILTGDQITSGGMDDCVKTASLSTKEFSPDAFNVEAIPKKMILFENNTVLITAKDEIVVLDRENKLLLRKKLDFVPTGI